LASEVRLDDAGQDAKQIRRDSTCVNLSRAMRDSVPVSGVNCGEQKLNRYLDARQSILAHFFRVVLPRLYFVYVINQMITDQGQRVQFIEI